MAKNLEDAYTIAVEQNAIQAEEHTPKIGEGPLNKALRFSMNKRMTFELNKSADGLANIEGGELFGR